MRRFLPIPEDIAARAELEDSAKLLYALILRRQGQSDGCRIGHEHIRSSLGWGENSGRRVRSAIKQLVDAGLIGTTPPTHIEPGCYWVVLSSEEIARRKEAALRTGVGGSTAQPVVIAQPVSETQSGSAALTKERSKTLSEKIPESTVSLPVAAQPVVAAPPPFVAQPPRVAQPPSAARRQEADACVEDVLRALRDAAKATGRRFVWPNRTDWQRKKWVTRIEEDGAEVLPHEYVATVLLSVPAFQRELAAGKHDAHEGGVVGAFYDAYPTLDRQPRPLTPIGKHKQTGREEF